ncbi:hypothetical protein GGH91_003313 [Coemansia sp. RSA 2671]|uniref:Late embryogenesis abundant protein LEA-2 subgroup domain-containing protein n=2 Tax=Coemansia TaxID=4863 RepID=A0A9W8GNU4_9FUNG|nr:hypothetical protein LPJ60_005233 [Coemansia sp. RSA 2675]KAJ2028506.1 hypothetical protein IWW57_002118 [Coemansia sp. S610]KAJ2343069.1 hypothetical protein GGH91_003313 [Coemansia sp. RSA 2671]KAJ2380283.1 hypothetical protein H4S02_006758 [Coemansia sp. RSA 2611]KAJ2690211.1 hypothetical protein IWW39_000892 [Coemansia spiralis]KAJ2700189.1 hypothetical protein H4218_002182 [Coemansia sp. IMI 209128]KAJ2790382.1 hypothetical protein GGI18_001836 [Coemansia linderi]
MADPFSIQPHSSSDDGGMGLGRNPRVPQQPARPAPNYSGTATPHSGHDRYSTYEYSDSASHGLHSGTDSPTSDYAPYFSAATNGGFSSPPPAAYEGGPGHMQQQYYQPHPDAMPRAMHSPYAMRGMGSDATALDGSGERALSTEKVEAPLLLTGVMGDAEKSPASYKARRKRRCCGGGRYCFCFSKRCCMIFIPVLLLILAGLGVTLYFVWPRFPEVTFNQVGVAKPSSSATGKDAELVSNLVDGATINRKGVVTVPLVIHLNVTNPNFIPWTIHNVTVSGYLKNTGGGDNFPVGEGGLRVPFSMPKKSVGNDMPIYFNFRLDTSNSDYLAAARIVQQACTPGGPQLRFYYRAQVILRAISWLGIKPTISDTINFECPISQINDLGIQVNDLTGLGATG